MVPRISRAILILVLTFSFISLPSIGPGQVAATLPTYVKSAAQSVALSRPHASPRNGIQLKRPPLRFEANAGQMASEVLFTARGREGVLFLTATEAALRISRPASTIDAGGTAAQCPEPAGYRNSKFVVESATVRLKPVKANSRARVVGLEKLPGVTNYLIGNDPKKWRTNVAEYARIKYEEVYRGIDLVYYGNDVGHLEYDFIVKPGADPQQIAISIEGADRVEIDARGDLMISAATGTIRQPAPRIYQEVNGERNEIAGSYRLLDHVANPESPRPQDTLRPEIQNQLVAFELADYDESRTLVIDPEVIYATYMGGSTFDASLALDRANAVAVDATGAAYLAGGAASTDFLTRLPLQPTFRGASEAFITKFDANGQLVYSTFLGGSGSESVTAIRVDETGAVYVGGSTGSPDFPMRNAARPAHSGGLDAFLTKLNATGSALDYSTYLGGRANEEVADLALDQTNQLYVLGSIIQAFGGSINDFPTVNPFQANYGGGGRDGFLSVISASGANLLYSTYLGGDDDDLLQSIEVDPINGDVYIGLFTESDNFLPSGSSVTGQSTQGRPRRLTSRFIRESPDIQFEYIKSLAEYAEEPSPDSITRTRVKKAGAIFDAFGISMSPGRISHNPGQAREIASQEVSPQTGGLDARITAFNRDLQVTNTVFFGGSREETVSALAIDERGAIYLTGSTTSTDLPTVNPIQANHGGGFSRDGFLAVFHPQTFAPVFATYLGGSGRPDEITGVTIDKQGNIYVVGVTYSTDFPTATPGAAQNHLSGWSDAFLIKISPVEFPTVPDFTLGFDMPTVTALRGTKVNLKININRTNGFGGSVTVTPPTLSVPGFQVKGEPVTTTGASVNFKLKLKGKAPVGPQQLTFTGKDETGRARMATVTVVVQ